MNALNVSYFGGKRIVLAVLVCFAAFVMASSVFVVPAKAGTYYRITPITDNDYFDGYPQVDNGKVVWVGSDGTDLEIFLYDTVTGAITQITHNDYVDQSAQIDDGKIVWEGHVDSTSTKIFLCDTSTGAVTQITDGKWDMRPQIDDGKIVWSDMSHVYLYDTSTGTTVQISPDYIEYLNDYPQIGDGKVVWMGEGPALYDWEIYLYDIPTGVAKKLTDNSYDDRDPQVDDGKIVWYGWDGNDYEIFFYDTATGATTQVTDNNYDDGRGNTPKIDDGKIVWTAYEEPDPEIFLYDTVTGVTTQITNNDIGDYLPAIDDGKVVWEPFGPYDRGISLYDVSTGATTQITNHHQDEDPAIDDGKIVWVRDADWAAEIFLASELVDTFPPTTARSLSGTIGDNGWYTSDVTVTLTATDTESGVANTYYSLDGTTWLPYTSPFTITSEGTHTLYYYSVDNAGNTETTKTRAVNIDKTSPVVTISLSGTLGNDGWYVSDVTVTLTATDGQSGIAYTEYILDGVAWLPYTSPFTVTAEGTHALYYHSVDNAGHTTGKPTEETIKIDKTPPNIIINQPLPGDYYNFELLALDFTATDSVSGIGTVTATLDGTAVSNGQVIDLSTLSLGAHTLTVTATDVAGLTATQEVPFNIIPLPPSIDVTKQLNRDTRNNVGHGRLVSRTTVINTASSIIKIEDVEQFPDSFTLQNLIVTVVDPSNIAYKYILGSTAYALQYVPGDQTATVTVEFPLTATLTYQNPDGTWTTQQITLNDLPANWVIQFQTILAPPSTLIAGIYTTTATVTAWATPTNYTTSMATATLTIEEKKNP